MRKVSLLLCCAVVAGAANAQSTTSSAAQPGHAQFAIVAAPSPTASNVEVADFFATCAAANADSVLNKQLLSDNGALSNADTSVNIREAKYYFMSAEAYSTKDHAKETFTELRKSLADGVRQKISGANLLDVAKEELNRDESQIALCTFYVGKNNASITAHVKQSGVLTATPAKPN
jgi:hypothetical protein